MRNIHDIREFIYLLIRHAESAPGHTPLVHLSKQDAMMLKSILTYVKTKASES